MIRLVIVDDQEVVRAGLRALLESDARFRVVAEAVDGRDGVAAALRTRPDVVLMDLQMPGLDGVGATAALSADPDGAEIPVLVLTAFADEQQVLAAVGAGANGYVLKDADAAELREAVAATARGGTVLAPPVAASVLRAAASGRAAPDPRLDSLTERELGVLQHVGLGLSNAEIGERLHLSPDTVRTYVSRLLSKLGMRDRTQLAVLAHTAGVSRER